MTRISAHISVRERRLRHAAALHHSGSTRDAERRLFSLALREAEAVTRALGLQREPDELAVAWMEKNLAGFLRAAKRRRAIDEAPLLARMKRALRSRAIDAWRAEYAERNPIAHYYWVRFGKVLRRSSVLVERDGFVMPRGRRFIAPGRVEDVVLALITPRPALPVQREQRLRSPRGAEKAYVPWMSACLDAAGGKLKRRVLAELLAISHGVLLERPSYRGERFEDGPVVELPATFHHADERALLGHGMGGDEIDEER